MTTTIPRQHRVREPIVVAATQHDFFPRIFVWRGQRHDVQSVEACRTEVRRGWRGEAARHIFTVRARGALFQLSQDVSRGTWELDSIQPSG